MEPERKRSPRRGSPSPVWSQYLEVQGEAGQTRYKCPRCGATFAKKSGSGYLERHLLKCAQEPSPGHPLSSSKQDQLILNMIISERLPLSIVEHSSFRLLFPKCGLTSAKAVKKKIEEEANSLRVLLFKNYASPVYASLVIDGWASPSSHLYAVGVNMGGGYYFYKQYSIDGKQNASWIASFLKPIVEDLKAKNIVISSITSDNAMVLQNACRGIESVLHHRCASHCLNLLIKKYLDNYHIRDHISFFETVLKSSASKYKVVSYVPTRWYSLYGHVQSILQGFRDHLNTCHAQIAKMEEMLVYLEVFNRANGLLEKDSCTVFDEFSILCDMKERFQQIDSPISEFIVANYDTMFKDYFDVSGIVGVAGFLNPQTRDKVKILHNDLEALISTTINLGKTWGLDIQRTTLKRYANVQPPFIFGAHSPLEAWSALDASVNDVSIHQISWLVEILSSVSPTETYIERAFSGEGMIHSPSRYSLKAETVDNIMFLYMNKAVWRRVNGIF